MIKYIEAEKLIAYLEKTMKSYKSQMVDPTKYPINHIDLMAFLAREYQAIIANVKSLQQEQPINMIQWTGNNLKEIIDFTGKSPRFGEWFKSWEEYENYVHTHNDILKLFCEDGSHYEVPVGAWIVKTPDGYNLPSVAKYIQQKQPEEDIDIKQELYHHFGQVKDFTLGMAIASFFYKRRLNARKEK